MSIHYILNCFAGHHVTNTIGIIGAKNDFRTGEMFEKHSTVAVKFSQVLFFQPSKMSTWGNDRTLYYCSMINIISEQIPLIWHFHYKILLLVLWWEKHFFSRCSPAGLGRFRRKIFCELWFGSWRPKISDFLSIPLDVIKCHDFQRMVFPAVCSYLDTSKCFMLSTPLFKYPKEISGYKRSFFPWNLCPKLWTNSVIKISQLKVWLDENFPQNCNLEYSV